MTDDHFIAAVNEAADIYTTIQKLQERVRIFSASTDRLSRKDPQISSELKKAFTLLEYASHEVMGAHYDLNRMRRGSTREAPVEH